MGSLYESYQNIYYDDSDFFSDFVNFFSEYVSESYERSYDYICDIVEKGKLDDLILDIAENLDVDLSCYLNEAAPAGALLRNVINALSSAGRAKAGLSAGSALGRSGNIVRGGAADTSVRSARTVRGPVPPSGPAQSTRRPGGYLAAQDTKRAVSQARNSTPAQKPEWGPGSSKPAPRAPGAAPSANVGAKGSATSSNTRSGPGLIGTRDVPRLPGGAPKPEWGPGASKPTPRAPGAAPQVVPGPIKSPPMSTPSSSRPVWPPREASPLPPTPGQGFRPGQTPPPPKSSSGGRPSGTGKSGPLLPPTPGQGFRPGQTPPPPKSSSGGRPSGTGKSNSASSSTSGKGNSSTSGASSAPYRHVSTRGSGPFRATGPSGGNPTIERLANQAARSYTPRKLPAGKLGPAAVLTGLALASTLAGDSASRKKSSPPRYNVYNTKDPDGRIRDRLAVGPKIVGPKIVGNRTQAAKEFDSAYERAMKTGGMGSGFTWRGKDYVVY